MKRVLNKRSNFFRHYLALLGIICAMGVAFSGIISFSFVSTAYASPGKYQGVTPCSNPAQPAPSNNSLLVVLLDRSGSLVADASATDPDLYSASVTKALADVWPGKMAIVAFHTIKSSGNDEQVQLTTIGPLQVGGDQTQRGELKNQVQLLPKPSLGTPTGPAMDKALEIIGNEKAPLSRVVLITDGEPGYHSNDPNANDPDGLKEESYIRSTLLKKYCDAVVPVDTVGLKIDSLFLSDVATGTGGQYQSVQSPKDLANAVLGLYAKWQQNRLNFQPLQLEPDGTYHVSIGDLARSLDFFVFSSSNAITIRDPNGQSLQAVVSNSVDRHYVYETLDLSPPRPQGDYSIDVGGDPQAQVYAFIESRLRVQIVNPSETAQPTINQPVQIEAKLLDDQKPLPHPEGAAVTAYVTFTLPGQRPVTEQVDLQQQNGQGLFIGKTTSTYSQIGQLQVRVVANYTGVRAEEDVTTQVVCGSSVPCLVKQYQIAIWIAIPFLLLLLAAFIVWLIWRQQPAPFGTLRTPPSPRKRRPRDDDYDDEVALNLSRVESSRLWRQRIFNRSILTSSGIRAHPDSKGGFDFDLASFDLVFKKGRVVELRSTSMEPIVIKHEDNEPDKLDRDQSALLKNGDSILIANKERAIFSSL